MEQGHQTLITAKEFFESAGINVCDIVPPIDSSIYCIKRNDGQWATFKLGNSTPIVPFGRYWHMWGYDGGVCLVSVKDKDKTTFANRGIINEDGTEVIEPYTFNDIWPFYGKKKPYIIFLAEEELIKLNKSFLRLI